MIKRSRRE